MKPTRFHQTQVLPLKPLRYLVTIDVLDIHRGLGLQQQTQQLRGARQSGVVQRREAGGGERRKMEGGVLGQSEREKRQEDERAYKSF